MTVSELNAVSDKIYTLGTSTRSAEEFVSLLSSLGAEAVADVRRFPSSRYEHFKRENLARLLQEAGLAYIYLGEEMGGYRRGGYESFLDSEQFRQGLEQLEAVIICAERLTWRCHRRFIGAELQRRDWEVIHVIDHNRMWQPKG